MKERLIFLIKQWILAFRFFHEDIKLAKFFLKYRLGLAKEGKDFVTLAVEEAIIKTEEEFSHYNHY